MNFFQNFVLESNNIKLFDKTNKEAYNTRYTIDKINDETSTLQKFLFSELRVVET